MSFLSRRILPSIPHSSRAYSSFFSSKSGGGGRFFNSAKPPKAVTRSSSSEPAEGANETKQAPSVASTPQLLSSGADVSSPSTGSTHVDSPTPVRLDTLSFTAPHPMVDTRDLKLLQFFSTHRPLLLLSHPPSLFQTPTPSTPLFYTAEQRAEMARQKAQPRPDLFEPSHEADAEAARQLSRAMTINHVGPAVAWEATLAKFGLEEPGRVALDKECKDIMMDSVKRKRRKKMKKHKLKKRRRETRAQRLKLR